MKISLNTKFEYKKVLLLVWKSTLALASSISNIRGFCSKDLARQINCLVPTDKFSPPSFTLAYNSPLIFLIAWVNCTSPSARHKDSSVNWSKGSKFDLIVPVNNNGSCGIIPIFDRKSSRPIFEILIPSMTMFPSSDSTSLNNADINEDLPAPVRPTIPVTLKIRHFPIKAADDNYLYSQWAW